MSKRTQEPQNDPGTQGGLQSLVWVAVAAALLVGGMGLWSAKQLEAKMTTMEARLMEVTTKLEARPNPAARRGPDPNQVYAVNTAGSPSKGAATAPIVIAEFSDFQCPFCSRVEPTLDRVEQVYGDKVRIVWKHNPLAMHPDAPLAHLASYAAEEQGKFWEYHRKLFTNQPRIQKDFLTQYAKELGLDLPRFQASIDQGHGKNKIGTDAAEAKALGVTGTPGFFINGHFLSGAQPFEAFARMINQELRKLNLPVPPEAAAAG